MPWLEWHNRDKDLKATAKTPYRLLQLIQFLSHGDVGVPNTFFALARWSGV